MNKEKLLGVLVIIIGALTVPIVLDATFFFLTLIFGIPLCWSKGSQF